MRSNSCLCKSLTDLSELSNLQLIGKHFMDSCLKLENIYLTELQISKDLIKNNNYKSKIKLKL